MIKKKRKIALIIIFLIIGVFFISTNKEIVISGSMKPNIKIGSLAFITQNVNKESLKKGDIVSYNLGQAKVLHRIIEIKKEGVITKGDNNKTKDFGIVPFNQINGKFLFSIPFIGYLIMFIKKHFILSTLIIILIIIFGFNKKEVREE